MMMSALLTGHGGNEVVRLEERDAPIREPGQVKLRMTAGGLNRVDLYMRNSGAGITHSLPMVMGLDGAGVVEEADATHRVTKGDAVVVYPALTCHACEFCRRGEDVLCTKVRYLGEHTDGTLSRFVCLPEENVFPAPVHLAPVEAASLSVAWLTAWRMIVTKARLQAGETVLIFGIGGSVSLAALQIGAAMGARTIVTSRSTQKLAQARALGAQDSICSQDEDIVRRVLDLTGGRGVDVVIENVGEAVWSAALKSLVRGGRLVTCGATTGDSPSADLRRLFIRQLQIFGSTLGTRAELAALIDFVAAHRLKPHIDSVYPLGEIHAALDRLEAGQQFGKIGIDLSGG